MSPIRIVIVALLCLASVLEISTNPTHYATDVEVKSGRNGAALASFSTKGGRANIKATKGSRAEFKERHMSEFHVPGMPAGEKPEKGYHIAVAKARSSNQGESKIIFDTPSGNKLSARGDKGDGEMVFTSQFGDGPRDVEKIKLYSRDTLLKKMQNGEDVDF